ncbi:hypothetical protein IGJ74_000850 [Enterococcus sp. AZ009]|uniref:DUF7006 family protein n=1 Tax=Enterococcus TaxID=1350 RepID=UPI001C496D48|nr:hypothetical protein [Enterococcus casseliflavus]
MFFQKDSGIQNYLKPFDDAMKNVEGLYPELFHYYNSLQKQLYGIENSEDLFLDKVKLLLTIDAKIQILFESISWLNDCFSEYSEKELITIIEHDSQFFYRERTGVSLNSEAPWSLIYLGERQFLSNNI